METTIATEDEMLLALHHMTETIRRQHVELEALRSVLRPRLRAVRGAGAGPLVKA